MNIDTSYKGNSLGSGIRHRKKMFLHLGQSNAVGVLPSFGLDAPSTGGLDLRVKQIGRFNGTDNYPVQLGIGNSATNGGSNSKVNWAYTFGKAYVKDTGNNVYILPIASSNTGFEEGSWRAGGALFDELVAEVSYFVSQGYDIEGLLWGQGEADTVANVAFVHKHLLACLMSTVRTVARNAGQLNASSIPLVTFNMVEAWLGTNTDRIAVQDGLQGIGSEVPFSANADFSGLPASLTGDLIHYDARQQVVIGQRMYDALAVAKANNLSITVASGETVLSNQVMPALHPYGFKSIISDAVPADTLYSRLGEMWRYQNSRGVYKYRMEWELTTGEVHHIIWEQDKIPLMARNTAISASLISKTTGAIFADNSAFGESDGFNGLQLMKGAGMLKLSTSGASAQNYGMICQRTATGDGSSTPIAKLADGVTTLDAVRVTLYAVID